jgi:hypothetical protein
MNNMTLEEALKRIEFLEKALNGAIGSCIKDEQFFVMVNDYPSLNKQYFADKPELVEYIKQNWLNALCEGINNE